jgi:hypothetical protein
MSSSSSPYVSRSSSSGSLDELVYNTQTAPLLPHKPKEEDKKDWVKTTAIVVAVIGALIAALGFACMKGIFPAELLGGTLGSGITLVAGAVIAVPAGVLIYERWNNSEESEKT